MIWQRVVKGGGVSRKQDLRDWGWESATQYVLALAVELLYLASGVTIAAKCAGNQAADAGEDVAKQSRLFVGNQKDDDTYHTKRALSFPSFTIRLDTAGATAHS